MRKEKISIRDTFKNHIKEEKANQKACCANGWPIA